MTQVQINGLKQNDLIYIIEYSDENGFLGGHIYINEYKFFCDYDRSRKIFINIMSEKSIVLYSYNLLNNNVYINKKQALNEYIERAEIELLRHKEELKEMK